MSTTIQSPPSFQTYFSLEQAYIKNISNATRVSGEAGDPDWVVTEKVHGANFSFTMYLLDDQVQVIPGRRSGYIPEAEMVSFYNAREVVDKYRDSMVRLFRAVMESTPSIQCVVVYGEIYGGSYQDLPKPSKSTKRVQREVDYCPHNDFYAFDIATSNTTRISHDSFTFMDYHSFTAVCGAHNVPYAKALFVGKLEDALEWSRRTNADLTTIPGTYHGLPTIEGNIREGNVVRPVVPLRYHDNTMVCLKDKNDKFKETSTRKCSKDVSITGDVLRVKSEIVDYVTPQRLCNVVSHYGEDDFTQQTIAKYIALLTQDILKDFYSDHSGAKSDKQTKNYLVQAIREPVRRLILSRLKE